MESHHSAEHVHNENKPNVQAQPGSVDLRRACLGQPRQARGSPATHDSVTGPLNHCTTRGHSKGCQILKSVIDTVVTKKLSGQ